VAVVAFTTGDAACDRASTHHDRAAAVTGVIQVCLVKVKFVLKTAFIVIYLFVYAFCKVSFSTWTKIVQVYLTIYCFGD
jgi:hypothetical protein